MSLLAMLLAGPLPTTDRVRKVARMSGDEDAPKRVRPAAPSEDLLLRTALFVATTPGCSALAVRRNVRGDTTMIARALTELNEEGVVLFVGKKPRYHYVVDPLPSNPPPRIKRVVAALRGAA